MARFVVLDSGPLRLATLQPRKPKADDCRLWIANIAAGGAVIIIPEIADYEVRRRYHKDGSTANLARLDGLKQSHFYLSITTPAMLRAAELWAWIRTQGAPPAPPEALDADTILVAMTESLIGNPSDIATIATGDKDIARFPGVDARRWETISADE